jgi:hypothetical protein
MKRFLMNLVVQKYWTWLRPLGLVIILSMFLVSCSPSINPTPTAIPTQPAPTQQTISATPTVAPTATSQPGKVLVVKTATSAADQVNVVTAAVQEQATAQGWTVETREAVQSADLTPEVRLVILFSAPDNLKDLVAAAAQVQWIIVSSTDVQSGGNLSVIRVHPEFQAFLSGFIVELIATDYRGSGLIPSDGTLGNQFKDAFVNGGHYYCGVCAPGWPLREYYPEVSALPVASSGADWQAAAAGLLDQKKVDVYYVSAEADKPELWTYLTGLAQSGTVVRVVGPMAPPDALKSQWAATVSFDLGGAVKKLWPDLVNGKGGQAVDASLLLGNVNSSNLGEGKMRLVNNLIPDLVSGKIVPYSVPAQ